MSSIFVEFYLTCSLHEFYAVHFLFEFFSLFDDFPVLFLCHLHDTFSCRSSKCRGIICSASSAAGTPGSSQSENNESPYEVMYLLC